MNAEILQRNDLSIYVLAGVPKSFRKKLQGVVSEEARGRDGGAVLLLDDALTEWVVARLQDEKRPRHVRTPGSAALWRAYRALSAARYHLKDDDLEPDVRAIRDEVELLWQRVSPLLARELVDETGEAPGRAADTEEGGATGTGAGVAMEPGSAADTTRPGHET
jgi:hypothetical protein